MIARIENALCALLAEKLPEYEVTAYPEEPKEYLLTHPLGAVLVVYGGSRFDGAMALGPVQRQRIEMTLILKIKSLRGNSGAYELIERIRRVLAGHEVCEARFYPRSERLEHMNAGVWTYSCHYDAELRQVADFEHPDDAAKASRFERLEYLGGTEDMQVSRDINNQP